MSVVLVTGASSGIGKASATLFADRGWNVVATMRNTDDGAGRIARQGRERASRAAQALPKLSRRLRGRLGAGSDGGAE